ncbi:GNAT family N-acetyltransferase [Natrialbaceae archaeon GCM10025810]|uniref:GNAT family N-acetyltransferase n=1 Tax=Halovalidus salilacus TaxID=3075124 RepID=UPI00361B25A9
MRIRRAREDDFESMTEVARETWHDTYDELERDLIDRTVDRWYTDDTVPLEAPGTVVLVAETDDGELVGFTHAVAHDEKADVLRMYVRPDRQGEGIGTDLHERLMGELEAYDLERVRSLDFAFNDASRAFYEGLGFEQSDEGIVEIEGDSYPEAVYTLEL